MARFVELIVVVTRDSCARQSRTAAHANLGCAQLNLAVADLVGHIRIRLKVRGFTRGHSGFNGHEILWIILTMMIQMPVIDVFTRIHVMDFELLGIK